MTEMKKIVPVLLLTGYLGSGKTTLLNRILANGEGVRFAVVVNDIGEVNIDERLIRKEGIVGNTDSTDLVALQNGCICCTLQTDLIDQLSQLADSGQFDYIVIEASGICEPEPIAQTICTMEEMTRGSEKAPSPRLDAIATVVDALRLASEFGCGESLTSPGIGEEDIENLIIQQIEFCNIILLNKISEVTKEQAARIRAIIRALQPDARIIDCDYCRVDLDRLLDTHLFDFEKTATSAAWVKGIESLSGMEEHHEHHHEHEHRHEHHHHHHDEGEAEEYGISTFVYFRRKPFDFGRFDDFCARLWPSSVIRCKGVIYFSHNSDMSVLFEQAGVQKNITEAGLWYAAAPEDELRILMQTEPGLARDWDPEYGDRMIKLVFIGKDMDKAAITAALDSCLAQ